MNVYRRKLKILAYLHNIIGRFRHIISSLLIIWAILIIHRSFDVPSYRREHIMWGFSVFLILLGFFIFKKGHIVFYNMYMKLQKEALSKYPHLYEKNWQKDNDFSQSTNANTKEKSETQDTQDTSATPQHDESALDFFVGVHDSAGIKKRYKELLKIYHPDNGSGDASTSALINQQYKQRLKELLKE